MPPAGRWRPPPLWRAAQVAARALVAVLGRLEVTGDLPPGAPPEGPPLEPPASGRPRPGLVPGPLILAANHISPVDPLVLTAACQRRRLSPRFLATGGLFRAPVVGAVMRHWGHIPVHRRTRRVTEAVPAAADALAAGSVILLYPEGRIGLDPGMWPERGRTGVARIALATGATVVPVAQWGAHELVPYTAPRGLLRVLPRTLWRRPVVRVRFGAPVDLSGLRADVAGDARRATDRIIAAIATELAPLRPDEPSLPRHHDPTRPRALPSEQDDTPSRRE